MTDSDYYVRDRNDWKGARKKYHTNPNCHRLRQRGGQPVEVSEARVRHRDLCECCAGTAQNTGSPNPNAYELALLAVDPDADLETQVSQARAELKERLSD